MACVFCDIANHSANAHIVFEDNHLMAFLDNDPINVGHVLIIPKKHYQDIDTITSELAEKIFSLAQKIVRSIKSVFNPDGYSIMQNGGSFCDFGHFHLHVFPRFANDGFGWVSSDKNFEYSAEIAQKIAKHLDK